MKIYIFQDMEGVSGVVDWSYDLSARGEGCEIEARRLMTREINAAIEGAFEGGANEVVVHESHKYIIEELHPKARYVMGFNLFPKIDATFDALFIVGQHAMARTENGTLCHSFSSKFTREMYLNNKPIGEIGWFAAFAGYFGVPVVLVTGDVAATKEAQQLLGNIEVAAVKEGLGINSAICMSPQKAQELIKEKAIKAVKRIDETKPYVVRKPIEYKVEFNKPIIVERCMLFPGVQRIDATTVMYKNDDFMEIFKFRAFTALINWF